MSSAVRRFVALVVDAYEETVDLVNRDLPGVFPIVELFHIIALRADGNSTVEPGWRGADCAIRCTVRSFAIETLFGSYGNDLRHTDFDKVVAARFVHDNGFPMPPKRDERFVSVLGGKRKQHTPNTIVTDTIGSDFTGAGRRSGKLDVDSPVWKRSDTAIHGLVGCIAGRIQLATTISAELQNKIIRNGRPRRGGSSPIKAYAIIKFESASPLVGFVCERKMRR